MTATKRLLPLTTLSLGGIGVVVCVAGILGVLLVGSRLNRTADNVFTQIDSCFATVRDRFAGIRERVQAAKITSQDIEQGLKDWTKKQANDRLISRLEVEERAEQLASGLQQADQWLEFSESSIQLVQQALEVGKSTGAPVDTDAADRLLEDLASLRIQLTQATESAERIRARTAKAGEANLLEEDINPAIQLALRVIATLGSIDSRLEELGNSLSETRTKVQSLRTRYFRWMRIATIGIILLISWMAAGQCSLCLHGWQSLYEPNTNATTRGD
jgi:hypothetical protein